jgi:hypothetical protein
MPDFESAYADEGTKAHNLAEQCLLKEVNADTLTDDTDLSYAVQVYLDYVFQALKFGSVKKIWIEQKFDLSDIHPDIGGTADCVLLTKKGILEIVDYKHGQGVVVEPKDNPQLMIYALGAHSSLNPTEKTKVKKVIMTIAQPRAHHDDGAIRSHEMKIEDLVSWGQKVLKPAAKMVDSPKAVYVAGDHCRFCKALAVCPEQAKIACVVAQTDFAAPVLPKPETLSITALGDVLDKTELFASWANAVKVYAYNLLKSGQKVDGWKLVEKRANRDWISSPELMEELKGILGDDGFTKKFISVAQAEKLVKHLGFDSAMLEPYWFKPSTGLSLARENDKRRAISPADDFNDVEMKGPKK